MANAVYVLCAVASAACALLLLRNYRRAPNRLTMWTAICFGFLFVNNVLLVIDLGPGGAAIDLSIIRNLTALLGVGLLLYGLVTETV